MTIYISIYDDNFPFSISLHYSVIFFCSSLSLQVLIPSSVYPSDGLPTSFSFFIHCQCSPLGTNTTAGPGPRLLALALPAHRPLCQVSPENSDQSAIPCKASHGSPCLSSEAQAPSLAFAPFLSQDSLLPPPLPPLVPKSLEAPHETYCLRLEPVLGCSPT